jgi:aminoglycoside N3'-acetyltransferase
MRNTKNSLVESIFNLGVKSEDVIFVSADLLKIGYFNKSIEQTYRDWVEIFNILVGSRGTLVIPAYTQTFNRFKKNRNVVFHADVEPSAGALSKAIYHFGNPLRSEHPTNSCFAIGPMSGFILRDHNQYASSYLPYHRVIELNGKNLMLGTLDRNNGPMAFHYIQEKLGHTLHHPSNYLRQTYIKDLATNKRQIYSRKDVGGCTRGLYNLVGRHLIDGAMTVGYVGKGLSAYIDTQKSAKIIENVMHVNPGLVRCDHNDCVSCYGRYVYNGMGIFKFWPKKIYSLISKK